MIRERDENRKFEKKKRSKSTTTDNTARVGSTVINAWITETAVLAWPMRLRSSRASLRSFASTGPRHGSGSCGCTSLESLPGLILFFTLFSGGESGIVLSTEQEALRSNRRQLLSFRNLLFPRELSRPVL